MKDEARDYRRKGFLVGQWAKTPTLERLNALCRDLYEGRIKEGYDEIVHYDGMGRDVILDHNYDSVLVDVLFENGLPALLNEMIGPNATLFYINAVTSVPPGYMSYWHSDGYVRSVHKLFYYPSFDGQTDECLQVIPGHTKPHWVSSSRLLSNKYVIRLETALSKKHEVRSSNDSFVVLQTETTHRAVPVTRPNGVFRLMYSFIDWFKDDEERRRITSMPATYVRINDRIVEHYRNRLVRESLQSAGEGHVRSDVR